MKMRIHHIGYLVKNIDKALLQFELLGYVPIAESVYDQQRGVYVMFLENDGYRVELVTPSSEKSIVAKLIKTVRNTPYHICYESNNFEEDIKILEKSGFMRIDDPCPAPALDGCRVCFFQSAKIGMIELLERK